MLRVEIVVYKDKRRSVVIFGLESQPTVVMSPATYESIKDRLHVKYGDFEEKEIPASPELLAEVARVAVKMQEQES